jgi:hypothetical protein
MRCPDLLHQLQHASMQMLVIARAELLSAASVAVLCGPPIHGWLCALQIAALKASHGSQQQELGQQYDSQLAQLRALASGLGRSMQQVSELSRSAAAQNSALQEALDATKAAWEQDQKMVEQQSQRIDHLERQLLQVGSAVHGKPGP